MATDDVLKRIAAVFGCEPDDDDDLVEAVKELVRERDEARADLARSVAAWESAGMQGRTAHDAMLALAKERDEARAEVDAAYLERNQLVALLSKVFPAGLKRTEIPGWSPEWHGCVFVDFPWGQASWHYHERDAALFAHLGPYTGKWDGHTTEEKYKAIAAAQVASYADLRAEVERAIIDRNHAEARAREYLIDARDDFRCGAEAMREACAREVHGFLVTCFDVPRIEEAVRALPIPEKP